jgi:flagellar biosynthesis anti-sigma factor FlgM
MKIYERGPLGSAGPSHGAGAADGVDGQSTSRSEQARSSEDRAVLSGLASRLAEALQAESPERAARLTQLKAAVAGGKYRADSETTSRAIVKDVLSPPGDAR